MISKWVCHKKPYMGLGWREIKTDNGNFLAIDQKKSINNKMFVIVLHTFSREKIPCNTFQDFNQFLKKNSI